MKKGDPFKREMLTEKIEKLDNQPIRIRGYILPSFQQKGITQFVLVRDNMECCFGPGALLHDCMVVRMQPGKTTDFSIRPVAVTGTLFLVQRIPPNAGDQTKVDQDYVVQVRGTGKVKRLGSAGDWRDLVARQGMMVTNTGFGFPAP